MVSEHAHVINRSTLCFATVGLFVLLAFGPLPKSASTSAQSSPMSLADCTRYQSYFEEAAGSYSIPVNLLKTIALHESGCQQIENPTDHGCGVMQLTGPTLTSAVELLGTTQDEICADTDAGARLNILGGAAVLRDKACWAVLSRFTNDHQFALCQQNDPNYALSNEEKTKLSETLESWWFPVVAYNGGGKDGLITTSNYPYRVWSRFADFNIPVSYPPISRIAYLVRGDRTPDTGAKVKYWNYEILPGDDDLSPKPFDLGKTPINGIRWTSSSFNPFREIPLHRNDGSLYSGTTHTLAVSIDPPTTQVKDWGESTSYLITVQGVNGNPTNGATVLVTNYLEALSTSTPLTNGNGQTTYTTAVPTGKPNGTYDITFVASRSGSVDSPPVTRQVQVSHSTSTASLTIASVDPPSIQTSDWGGSVTYSITVRDSNNNPIGGATVLVSDNLRALSTSTPLTNSNGQTTYTTAVPSGEPNGTYDVIFAASKSGYTGSASVARQVQVNHAIPLSIASLTPSGLQTADWGGTVTYNITVTDINNNPVSGAVVRGHDSLWGTDYATTPTNGNGQTSYVTFAPNGRLNGIYDIAFTASRPGYTDSATLTRQVQVNHTGTITVTAPVAGAMWTIGTSQLVTWSTSGVIGGLNVKLSTDGGSTFPVTLVANTVNSDVAGIVVPNTPSATCRVRVESVLDPNMHGENPGNFSIVASPQSWIVQRSGGASLKAVYFLDANQGWAVGSFNTILHTTNGGATWDAQTGPQSFYDYYAVYFADANNGWVGGSGNGGVILHTTNGGATWAVQFDGGQAVATRVWWISGIDGNHLWAASQGGLLYTTNGGANWQTRTMDALWKVKFADSSTGWATTQVGQVLRTTDGGNSWQTKYTSSGGYVLDVAFVGASAWGVGSFKIVHTSDAGSTWQNQTSAIPTTLRSVTFIDGSTGWAVGDGGDIINTTNGGATWSAVSNLTSNMLWDVFFNGRSGWAVGDGGVILKYGAP